MFSHPPSAVTLLLASQTQQSKTLMKMLAFAFFLIFMVERNYKLRWFFIFIMDIVDLHAKDYCTTLQINKVCKKINLFSVYIVKSMYFYSVYIDV